MTGSVESDSTADVVAPTAEAGRDGNVERFPGQQRTPTWPARPQASPELQHSDRESEIHFRCLCRSGLAAWHNRLNEKAGFFSRHVIVPNRRDGLNNFENTSRWQILQWLASE
jgi:hypothetical protein